MRGAASDRVLLLGELLRLRRAALGFRHVPAFVRDRGINTRMVGDIEHGRRDTYTFPTLDDVAAAYEVTYASMMAVVWSDAGELVPAETAPADAPVPPGELPDGVEARTPAAQDYADQIWERLLRLSDSGITAPTGAQLFPDSPADARTWDDPRLQRNWTVRARVRMIADLQYLDARPGRGEHDGTAG
jgi:hypothetical protein